MIYSEQFITRFWSKVDKTSSSTGCWLWCGEIDKDGYGKVRTARPQRKWLKAHRVAWELTVGLIPTNLHVLHKPPCTERHCILHLYLGTNTDNIQDMLDAARAWFQTEERKSQRAHYLAKSNKLKKPTKQSLHIITNPPRSIRHVLHKKGEEHPLAKLSDNDVLTIRTLYATGAVTQKHLARQYHVTRQHISAILTNTTWSHLPCDAHTILQSKHANQFRGEKVSLAKLTAAQVAEIRAMAIAGIPRQDIARNFGITDVTVGHIINRKTWKHIP